MRYYYGDKMLLRILDEAEFWKRQEQEHTVVIGQLVADLEKEYISKLEEWGRAFAQTEGTIVRYVESVIRSGYPINPVLEQQIIQLIACSLQQSQEFVRFLNAISRNSTALRNNTIALVVINHIVRESEYYIGISQAFLTP